MGIRMTKDAQVQTSRDVSNSAPRNEMGHHRCLILSRGAPFETSLDVWTCASCVNGMLMSIPLTSERERTHLVTAFLRSLVGATRH